MAACQESQITEKEASHTHYPMTTTATNLTLLIALSFLSSAAHCGGAVRRRLLHQPLFPIDWTPPPSPPDSSDPPPSPPAITTAPPSLHPRHTASPKILVIAVSAAAAALLLLSVLAFLLYRRRTRRVTPPESRNLAASRRTTPSSGRPAAEFLYIGTVEPEGVPKLAAERVVEVARQHPSPDLQPLPPLIGHAARSAVSSDDNGFYTPNHSLASMTSGSPVDSASRSRRSSGFPQNLPPPPPPPPPPPTNRANSITRPPRPPPPPPPLNRSRVHLEFPPALVPPRPTTVGSSSRPADADGDNPDATEAKPRLKPLHWDKVGASSDRVMVWDQLKVSSFRLNEDEFESMFINSPPNHVPKETRRGPVVRRYAPENRVLDPKKSQNIAILLRALNVTWEEVSEALLDGNPEGVGDELLETLAKMAPTKEEELKLRNFSGDLSKLGSAERFLKAMLDIPFAFQRVDAMLYKANFETELKYLINSFNTLEAACEDLRSSRLFLKILEAVLKTGNRVNVGTNRGRAKSFKLDTLLKLADVKGTDGKITLLHVVVQEVIQAEGSCSAPPTESSPDKAKEEDFRKQGLKVVARLSKELGNVKKAAGIDSDVLSSYVSKLEEGLQKIKLVMNLEKSCSPSQKFVQSMEEFLREAESEIDQLKTVEMRALEQVREITEYFHGDAAKEGAHPLRIFMVVRDFLAMLDNVCKEVGRIQERTMIRSGKSFRISANASSTVFNRNVHKHDSSSDEDSSSS